MRYNQEPMIKKVYSKWICGLCMWVLACGLGGCATTARSESPVPWGKPAEWQYNNPNLGMGVQV